MRDAVRSVVKPAVRRAVRAEYAFRMTFSPGVIPAGLVTTIAGSRWDYLHTGDTEETEFGVNTPTITDLGLMGNQDDEYSACYVDEALDLTEGQIEIRVNKATVNNDLIQIRGAGVSEIENTGAVADIKIMIGTPPAWWLTKYGLSSGSYMQVVSGGNQAYQTWTPGSLRRVRFMDKVGAGERTGLKYVRILKTARGWV